jgi:hypothetical protein
LNILRPLFDGLRAILVRRWGTSLMKKHFRTFSPKRENGFIPFMNCFVLVSRVLAETGRSRTGSGLFGAASGSARIAQRVLRCTDRDVVSGFRRRS